jgi:hypothetical protein
MGVADAHREKSLGEVGALYDDVSDEVKAVEERLSLLKAERDGIEFAIIHKLREQKLERMTTARNNYTISPKPRFNCTNPAQLKAWLKENRMEDLLTINYQTLQSVMAKRLEEGEEIPEAISIFMEDNLSRRKAG